MKVKAIFSIQQNNVNKLQKLNVYVAPTEDWEKRNIFPSSDMSDWKVEEIRYCQKNNDGWVVGGVGGGFSEYCVGYFESYAEAKRMFDEIVGEIKRQYSEYVKERKKMLKECKECEIELNIAEDEVKRGKKNEAEAH